MSRAAYPKQLLPLLSHKSLLQETALRLTRDLGFECPIVIANEEHRFIIAEQLRQIDVAPEAFLLEPMGRNTAPAAAVAAHWVLARDPNALMLIVPSDHAIQDPAAFADAVKIGAEAAASGQLVTFGIRADSPDTGYGYIKHGEALATAGAHAVAAFIEKPARIDAEAYVADGGYSWNSGIFLFPVELYLAELKRNLPETVKQTKLALDQAKTDLDFVRLDAAAFAKADNKSIDYAVMEHTSRAAVVPVTMGWSDVGNWDALWEIAADADESGNAALGDVVAVDCENSYLRSEEQLLAVIGVKDLVVVATADAILVAPRDRAQDVKQLVDRLKAGGRPELTHSATVHRPWGTYRSIHAGDRVQVKHIMVHPGGKLSLQMHHHRAEHWVVVRGTAKIVRNDETLMLSENESTYIPLGAQHRLENPGRIPLHLIEVQSGSYLGEDDIVRFEDTYGRS
jgi:mannose-1-phosphate guanylyltransferase/mannose-6-phosphate isomerase